MDPTRREDVRQLRSGAVRRTGISDVRLHRGDAAVQVQAHVPVSRDAGGVGSRWLVLRLAPALEQVELHGEARVARCALANRAALIAEGAAGVAAEGGEVYRLVGIARRLKHGE